MKNSNIEDISDKAAEWLRSEAGQAAINKAIEEAKAIIARLQEERLVDYRSLHEPFLFRSQSTT